MEKRPELLDGLGVYWDAFTELSRARTYGLGGPSPIAWTDLVAWLELNAIEDLEDRLDFSRFVRHMDSVWLDWQYSRKKSKNANARNGS